MQTKKEKVLEAVFDTVLETGGISGVTVSEIARRAGIGKGSVYMYFASKDQMIFEAAKYLVESTMVNITEFSPDQGKSFKENMLSFLQEHINVMNKYSSVFYAVTGSNFIPQFTPGLKEKMVGVIEKIKVAYQAKLISLLEMGAAEGIVSRGQTPFELLTVSQMFFSSAAHFAQKDVPHVSSDVDEYVMMMYDMAIKMLN
jgi:AcrR family transcriptional regulator